MSIRQARLGRTFFTDFQVIFNDFKVSRTRIRNSFFGKLEISFSNFVVEDVTGSGCSKNEPRYIKLFGHQFD